ncbi:hypothetical protein HYH03_005907 [Edaphochlamys debaryana]|uniref:Uncharacterized protein n=1 Tax=Edaphochlamys debaryana TaxID=47281 RepID=A0A835Y4T8_9CHLO|nr:hypothetical protein HYH03_005907 [Edaphochlamys debaryana]|eukprot:KAG2495978.1 hypothetical protein HYH03_005907 [Edaphochlamys debaryana]
MLGGAHFVNKTRKPIFVLVIGYWLTPFPTAFFRALIRLKPGQDDWVFMGYGSADVFAWEGTGDEAIDSCILHILGQVFVTLNVLRLAFRAFGGYLIDGWAEGLGLLAEAGSSIIDQAVSFFIHFIVEMVMDGCFKSALDAAVKMVLDRAEGIIKGGVRRYSPRRKIAIRKCYVTNTVGVGGARLIKLQSLSCGDFEVQKGAWWDFVGSYNYPWTDPHK